MNVGVVGAGITGLFAALSLQRAGATVTIYDAASPGARSIHAAGIIEPTTAYRTNTLAFLRRVVKYWRRGTCAFRSVDGGWLFESLRTLERPPPGDWEAALDAMGRASLRAYATLAEEQDDFGFAARGLVERYDDPAHFEEACRDAAAKRDRAPFEVRAREGGPGDLYFPEVAWVHTERCADRLVRELGATTFVRASVTAVDLAGRISTDVGDRDHDCVVVCTGVTSRSLGLPLTAVRGYGWHLRPARPIDVATIHVDRGIALVPFGPELKVTGGWDFDLRGTRRRAEEVLDAVRELVAFDRVLDVQDGARPCTPDGLPTAGRVERLVVANGGFRLGWSFAPALGDTAARLALEERGNDPFLARYCGALHAGPLGLRGTESVVLPPAT